MHFNSKHQMSKSDVTDFDYQITCTHMGLNFLLFESGASVPSASLCSKQKAKKWRNHMQYVLQVMTQRRTLIQNWFHTCSLLSQKPNHRNHGLHCADFAHTTQHLPLSGYASGPFWANCSFNVWLMHTSKLWPTSPLAVSCWILLCSRFCWKMSSRTGRWV